MTKISVLAALVAAVTGGATLQAAPLEEKTAQGIRYVSGGVGEDEQQQIQSLRSGHNLRVLTAQRGTGDYFAGAQVTILRGQETVLQAVMDGPYLLAQLPPGSYAVRVALDGNVKEQRVAIGFGGGRDVYAYWD